MSKMHNNETQIKAQKKIKKTVNFIGRRIGRGIGSGALVLGFVSIIAIASSPISYAAPHSGGAEHGHGKAPAASKGPMHASKHGGKHKKKQKSGTFSPHWVKTLTDEQKISFDKMHLAVGQFEAINRAKLKMLKAELNVLVAKEMNNKSFIYAKIDEILDVKKGLMRNRYDHIAEMRAELTEQQRISYDMGLLKRGKHKH